MRSCARTSSGNSASPSHGPPSFWDVSRPNLSLFLNEWIDLSPEMALKLEAAFGLEPAMLLAMQTDRNLARARERQAEITAKVRAVEREPRRISSFAGECNTTLIVFGTFILLRNAADKD